MDTNTFWRQATSCSVDDGGDVVTETPETMDGV